MVKKLPAMWETQIQSLGREGPLEKGMPTHSSILAWKIPWTEKPGGLQSIGLQRVWDGWETNTCNWVNKNERQGRGEGVEWGKVWPEKAEQRQLRWNRQALQRSAPAHPSPPQATITNFLPGSFDYGNCGETQKYLLPPFFFLKATLISSLQIKFPWWHIHLVRIWKEYRAQKQRKCARGIFLKYLFIYYVAIPCGLWDLSFLTRDWICAPCNEPAEL